METTLRPRTDVGGRFVEQAEKHAADFATRAAEHDHAGTFPHENFDDMKASGFTVAPVPEEFGGWGLTSNHDLAVGIAALARADGSTAIGINMHMTFGQIGTYLLRGLREAGDAEGAESIAALLGLLGGGGIAMANATEPGTDFRHPLVEATPVEGGFALNGRKIFSTLSEVADLFFVPCRKAKEGGGYTGHFAIVFRGTPGQSIGTNWDALGMRASGSHDVVYEDCVVPEALLQGDRDWGQEDEMGLIIATAGNLPLIAASYGIAEAARDHVVDMVKKRTKAPSNRPLAERRGVQQLIAEMEVDLTICRALIEHLGTQIDQVMRDNPVAENTMDELHDLNREFQCAKLVVNRKAIEIVDKAMTASGGAGYLSSSPLSRYYRDVRAGPFMQPFSPVEAYEYIGKVALGLDPAIEV